MDMDHLPLGIQEFRYLREGGFHYVDKTPYINLLMQNKRKHFFLSRPRRFGKSLFVDTLKEAFEGSKELFEGLAINDRWDWSAKHPVIRLDYSAGNFRRPGGLANVTNVLLGILETEAGLESSESDPAMRLHKLIYRLYAKTGQRVVLLVDEYDKPMLDVFTQPELAIANRDMLHDIYGVIKQTEGRLRMSFFTGVTKFSKTNLFSGVNNLEDLTLDPKFSTICGYTEAEIDAVFGRDLEGLDREEIRDWYNGYNWLGDDKVYNPHDILLLLKERKFDPWWYDTGTPSFLIDAMKRDRIFSVNLGEKPVTESLLSKFDVGAVEPLALLFQAGYLTIAETERIGNTTYYTLDYPNKEVEKSLNILFEQIMFPEMSQKERDDRSLSLYELFRDCDADGLENHFKSLFASLPHYWYDNSKLADYEAHCSSVFFSHLMGASMDVRGEDPTNRGRVDMAVIMENRVYIIEFKIKERATADDAMEQMRAKGYAEKYRSRNLPISLVAVEYSSAERNITGFRLEPVDLEAT